MAEEFDIGPLTWVKDEIDQALNSVLDSVRALELQMDGEAGHEEIGSLKFCQTHLYQVSGALDMVGLEGCKRFCAEIETVCGKLEQRAIGMTPEVLALLRHAIETLSAYLQGLLQGKPDQPLSLYPLLQSMLQLQGEHAGESELFFPDTSLRAPKEPVASDIESPPLSDTELSAYISQQRALFQKSLLNWLKTKNAEGLQGMVNALANVQTVQSQPAQHTLWWSAVAFIDTLPELNVQQQPNALKLCRRIDQQLNASGKGASRAIGNLLRDILFYVGTSPATSERVVRVKALFKLEDLLPQTTVASSHGGSLSSRALIADELAVAQQLASAMDDVKNAWAAMAENQAQLTPASSLQPSIPSINDAPAALDDALQTFTLSYGSVLRTSQQLSHPALGQLFKAIDSFCLSLNINPPHACQITEDETLAIAAGLNLAEDALRQYEYLSAQDNQRLSNQAQRISSLRLDSPTDSAQTAVPDEGLGHDVVQALKLQIRNALQMVEQALDQYFRDTRQHAVLQTVHTPLEQVAAAYDMLNLHTAASLASASLSMVGSLRSSPYTQDKQAQHEVLAESLSMLDLLIDELPRLRPESEAALAGLLARLINHLPQSVSAGEPGSVGISDATQPVELNVDSEPSPSVADVPTANPSIDIIDEKVVKHNIHDNDGKHSTADAELLDIYLTEAEEVLASIAQNLQAMRLNVTDQQALVEVRRGFHTLKGSGRAVGLDSMADVASAVETLLNYVIEQQLAANTELTAFVERASAAFSQWIALLRDTGSNELEADAWQQSAQALQQTLATHKPKALAEEVVIGGTLKLSRALFTIFMAEAAEHLQVLRADVAAASSALLDAASVNKPNDDSRRAAHTLASNSAAAGFKAMSILARALEHWLDAHPGLWTATSVSLYANVVQALATMLEKAALLRQPKQVTALLAALKETTLTPVSDRLLLHEPVLDEPQQPVNQPKESDELKESEALEISTQNAGLHSPASLEPTKRVEKAAVGTTVISRTSESELLLLFIEEARELIPGIGNALRAWHSEPHQLAHADELQRVLHTLKGSARMAGQSELADTVHMMEDQVIRGLKSKTKQPDFDGLFVALDQLAGLLESTEHEGAEHSLGRHQPTDAARSAGVPLRAIERTQYLRLQADVLDRLINEAGEISIARSRMDREMQGFKQSSQDLSTSVLRLRNQLREMEIEAESQLQSRMALLQEANENFDPLEFDRFTRLQELTRMMAESVNDVATIQHGLLMNLEETQSALQQQQRMNRELQRGLMNVRMVPFSMISERLQRIVRQTARELNKAVELIIKGEGVAIDRSVLDKIGAPLEHLLRNAVAHGVESRAERKKAKKIETGQIILNVVRENDEIVMTVSDDGAGIPLEKVRKTATEKGLFTQEQVVGDQALMQVIFESGFSTASKVTQIAGRGVGLDSVRSDISALGGRIDVSNAAGLGAVFTIFIPVTLSVAQVVLVRAGKRIVALPSVMVEQVQKLKPDALAACYKAQSLSWGERDFPMHFMSRLIGDVQHAGDVANQAEAQLYTPVLLLRSASYHIALHVDEIIGNQEVVMKPIGPQLAHVPGMIGATVMGDGSVVLILNAVQLANREALAAGTIKVSTTSAVSNTAAAVVDHALATVLVVDDSLTMRKVLGRLLEREGYRVLVAKDGMEALQLLQELRPHLILSDIEMPRMDGFELLRNIRADERIASIPVIIISSRTAEKHRNLAAELGVNAFLGKPVQEEELLVKIATLLAD